MNNNFIGFLLALAIAAPLYSLLNRQLRIYFLLLISLSFYAYFEFTFILVLLNVIIVTYICSFILQKFVRNIFILGLSILLVLAPLLFYKYILIWFDNFSAEWVPTSSLLFGGMGEVLIPVGLSFYTFQCLGYLFDIYKRLYSPERNLLKLAAFVSFFPQILAGPIEKFPDLSKQLFEADRPTGSMVVDGITLLLYGIFLKLAVAERLSDFVNIIFTNFDISSSLSIFLGLTAFTFQIFADFAGYSFIALGAAALFGVRLTNNFLQPFFAVSIVDFWQRWHVSLTRWAGDYVYKPIALKLLGNPNFSSRIVEYSTLFVTWLIIGMWHGALLNFAVFGVLQAILIISYGLMKRHLKYTSNFYTRLCGGVLTIIFVITTFGLIRAPDMDSYLAMLRGLFSFEGEIFLPGGKLELVIGLTILLFVEWLFNRNSPLSELREQVKGVVAVRSAVIVMLIMLIAFLGYDETSAFIYFQY